MRYMIGGYAKLFNSIVHSTVWRESDTTRILWITMLALADQDGRVSASLPGLADVSRISLADCLQGLATLSAPDPYSRSKNLEGRRVLEADGGWIIVNYQEYRNRMSEEWKRESTRLRVAKHRAKSVTGVTERYIGVTSVTCNASVTPPAPPPTHYIAPPITPIAEAEAEAEAKRAARDCLPPGESNEIPTGGPAEKKKLDRHKSDPERINGTESWEVYAMAYRARYGVEPVRNAKTNACMCRLTSRLPAADTADVIRWYVRHNDAVYVRAKHCVDLLLRDAEGLHTEMARGECMTSRKAREVDSAQTSVSAVEAVMKKHPEWS